MRFYRVAAALGLLALVFCPACGYLPSDMNSSDSDDSDSTRSTHARVKAKPHTVGCDAPARGFQRVAFRDLYTITGNPKSPFREADDMPTQFDVTAYVWGRTRCSQHESCEQGDHYWLIGKGPRGDFQTWVVTPQFPRIPIQSTCRQKLKVGEGYRFSFSHGKLVGFSR